MKPTSSGETRLRLLSSRSRDVSCSKTENDDTKWETWGNVVTEQAWADEDCAGLGIRRDGKSGVMLPRPKFR